MSAEPARCIALAGPTASGKSAAALAIAQRWPVEIISVDSALVYRGMDIGTAKPSAAERAAVPHHLIDLIEPTEAYSAARFVGDALALIDAVCVSIEIVESRWAEGLQAPALEPVFLASYFAAAALALPMWVRAVARFGLARSWGLSMLLAVAVGYVLSDRLAQPVAQALLVLMSGADGEPPDHPGAAQALAGYWLQGAGRGQLEHALGVRRHATDAVALWRSAGGLSRVPLYLGALLLGSLGLLAWLMAPLWGVQAGPDTSAAHLAGLALVAVLLLLPVSEIVVAVVNRLIGESVRPTYMPRYLLPAGIPVSARVLVAIPALLSSPGTIERLVHRLHLHYLANPEPFAQLALLTDGVDADVQDLPEDGVLLPHSEGLMLGLNAQHPSITGGAPRFLLLHRTRTYSPTQQQWIGWERKRGKLEQLVAALATGGQGAFLDLGELSHLAPQTRYVLTLDSDTQLPPGRLRSLVGVAEHPEN